MKIDFFVVKTKDWEKPTTASSEENSTEKEKVCWKLAAVLIK